MGGSSNSNFVGLTPGQRIAVARKKAGMSQLELSMLTGITRDTISRIETGRCTPRLETIELIEKCLGLPQWSLLTGEDRDIISESNDDERTCIYRQIIYELETRQLTAEQLHVVGNAAISFADSIKNSTLISITRHKSC